MFPDVSDNVGDTLFGDLDDFRLLLDHTDFSPEMKQMLADELIRIEIYDPQLNVNY